MAGLDLHEQLEKYEALLDDLEFSQEAARNDCSWQGYSAIVRQVQVTIKHIVEISAQISALSGDMTDEELLHELKKESLRMPDEHLEIFVDEYARRHKVPKLTLVK